MSTQPFAGKRILTVDDSSTIRLLLRSVFTPLEAVVEEAENGRAALALLDAGKRYDLALLDLLLPDMDGIQILRHIRSLDNDCAVVMLTATGGVKSAMAAVREGADGYMEKQELSIGGDMTEFFYAVEQAMERRMGLVAQRQLQEVKADFYSMVTHDLRNPTGSILITIDMLLDNKVDPPTPGQRELLELAQRAADKLIGLINNYLDYAKIDAGYLKLDRGEAELRSLLESSASLAQLHAQAKHQTFTLDLPPEPLRAYADAERLKQVFDNLISNAIKYTPDGGRVTVQLRIDGQPNQVVFRVSDTGNGIPPTQLPALFTKYHRVPGESTRGIRGTGLGLLIVKEIVEAHGGTVQVESEGVAGKGTTFTVVIPVASPAVDQEPG